MNLLAIAFVIAAPAATDRAPAGAQGPVDLVWMVGRPVTEPLPAPPRPSAALARQGRTLYRTHCAVCHGAQGRGDGALASRLSVPPTDFTRGVFKLRSTPMGSLPDDGDLFRTITRGVHGTPMLPANQLNDRQRWALVYQVKALSPRFQEQAPAARIVVPPPPRETAELRERGHALYHRLRCVVCHGEKGAGDGPAAAEYAAEDPARHVRVRDFTRGRFIRGAELADIYLTLRTGLDGTPMGSYDGVPAADLWALAAFVRDLVRERPLPELPPAGTDAAQAAR